MLKSYGMVAEQEAGETAWSITFPQFPGVTSVAEHVGDVMRQARDALETAIEDSLEHGEPVPPAWEDGGVFEFPEHEASVGAWQHTLLPVEVRGPVVRVNVTIEGALLSRLDSRAQERGMTRSGLLAEAARLVLAQPVPHV